MSGPSLDEHRTPVWSATDLIGTAVARQRDALLHVGPAVSEYVHPTVGSLVNDLVDRIRVRPFRLAVIGQTKAGKSSFLNALARQPGLLPTDVNPWTAVVTRVHFNHPSGRSAGGTFRFFSESEWQALGEGGQLRRLQAQLLPELDIDTFQAQVAALRERAAERLGADFRQLLGLEHDYAAVTPELVTRYVADQDSASGPVFSDITRDAELFRDGGSFALPMTLVDTPGTNDPFLVREEITLSCLDEMDAAVVLLSARQAYSRADLALLRFMRGLRRDRLLVVINRMDELEQPAEQASVVTRHVARLIEDDFGESVPVLTTSARWALDAEACGVAGLPAMLSEKLAAQLVAARVATSAEIARWRSADLAGLDLAGVRAAVRRAAGFGAVEEALDRLIASSGVGQFVQQAAATLVTVAEQQEALARRDLANLEGSLKGAHSEILSGSFELDRLGVAVNRLDVTMSKLDRIAAERTAEIETVQRAGLDRLRAEIDKTVAAFMDRERAAIVFTLDQQAGSKPVRYDVSRLRKEVEQVFLSEYRALYHHIVNIQLAASQHFRRLVNDELPSTNLDVHVNVISSSFTYPSLAALARLGTFDIDPKLWARWRRAKKSLREAVTAFEDILRSEFEVIGTELVAAAEREILGPASDLQRRLNLTIMDAMHSARQRRADMLRELETIRMRREPLMQERLLEEQLTHMTAARERLRKVDGLVRILKAASEPRFDEAHAAAE